MEFMDRGPVDRLRKLADRYDMTATERYEADAEAFYRETGFMSPGKDVPMAMGNQNEQERRVAWDAWVAERNKMQQADIRAVCAVLAHAMETLSRCPDCGGMGETTRDIIVNGNEHDTVDEECETCFASGVVHIIRATPHSERVHPKQESPDLLKAVAIGLGRMLGER